MRIADGTAKTEAPGVSGAGEGSKRLATDILAVAVTFVDRIDDEIGPCKG